MSEVLRLIKEATAQKAAQEKPKGLRVAAYCRVSTDSDEQKTSYRTQKAFYTDMIQRHPGWTFAGIYADEGITGTSRLHRDEFNQMLEDARNGKIDLIVTKSISRFARNTVDTLDCARQLKQLTPPVGIFFEKENINTLDSTSEVILTIYSALAQEESHSISDNIHWSYQKRFQEGKPMVHLSRMIGYDKGENGEWIINEEQAEPVRYLFRRYACGAGRATIIKEMNERGWKTVSGTDWNPSSFSNVILNEKYVGDLEMQKYVTSNFLSHKAVPNRGQLPKYYIRDHHAPIVDRATWLIVQSEMKRRPPLLSRDPLNICYVNLSCPACGKTMVHKRRKIAAYWVDAESIEDTKERQGLAIYGVGKMRCSDKDCTEELYEVAIEQGFMEMLYRLKRDYEENKEQSELAVKYRECQREPEDHSGRILELRELLQKLEQECKRLMKKQMEAQKKMAEQERVFMQESLQESIRDGSIQMDAIMEGMDQQRVDGVYTPAAGSAEAMYNELLKDILKRKEELENELHILEESSEGGIILKKRYEYFLEELLALPEQNRYGQKLVVHGLDDKEPQWTESGVFLSTPDMLTFSREMYGLTGNDIGTSFYHADYEEGSEIEAYASLAKDIRQRIESFRKEKETLSQEQGALTVMKKNFDLFIACLKELPEQNAAGMPLKVNGLDVQGSLFRDVDGKPVGGAVASLNRGRLKMTPERIAEAPDLLHFEKGIYCAFMKKGTVKGDIVLYETNFGVTLPTCGNQRTLTSFLGFKKCSLDGLVTLVDAPYRVYDNTVQYRRYLRSKAKREQAV